MPRLRIERHELFAHGVADGKTLQRAYIDAGYRDNRAARQNASRLHARDDIRQRIAELQEREARKTDVTPELIAKNLLEDRALALSLGQPSAAVAADRALAELFGLITKKHQVSGRVDHEHTWTHEAALERLMQRNGGTLVGMQRGADKEAPTMSVTYQRRVDSAPTSTGTETDTPHPEGGATDEGRGPIPRGEDDTAASPPEPFPSLPDDGPAPPEGMGFPVDLDDEDGDDPGSV